MSKMLYSAPSSRAFLVLALKTAGPGLLPGHEACITVKNDLFDANQTHDKLLDFSKLGFILKMCNTRVAEALFRSSPCLPDRHLFEAKHFRHQRNVPCHHSTLLAAIAMVHCIVILVVIRLDYFVLESILPGLNSHS